MADWTADAIAEQYADAANVDARESFFRRHTSRDGTLREWVFEQLDAPQSADVLTVGCGGGTFWRSNAAGVPASWSLTLTDVSDGMVAEARDRLGSTDLAPTYLLADVESLPFATGAFDAVVANHVLHLVSDRSATLRELARVLRPNGRLYATVTGEDHLRELFALVEDATGESVDRDPEFTVESGREHLLEVFDRVESHRRPDTLVVRAVEPLAAYVRSRPEFDEAHVGRFAKLVRRRLADGPIEITNSTGLLVAQLGPRE